MILLLDTSTPVCGITIYDGEQLVHHEDWPVDRALAEQLLGHLQAVLADKGSSLHAVGGIGVFKGPGSFTGLRIGLSVANTLADDRMIPIVGTMGEDWQDQALKRLRNGENDAIVLPEYGRAANITSPRK